MISVLLKSLYHSKIKRASYAGIVYKLAK